jgi:hypothetical protein
MARVTTALIVLPLALLAAPTYARQDASDISLDASFGIAGFYKVQMPTFVTLRITNPGDSLEGWALVNMQQWVPPTYYSRPVLVPPGGRQRLDIGCYGCYDANPCAIPVKLLTSDGAPVAEMTLQSWVLGRSDTLLVHLGEPDFDIDNLRQGGNPGFNIMVHLGMHPSSGMVNYTPAIFPVVLEPEDLPGNPLFLESVSVITMALETYLSLDREIADTILEYVLHGGNLLVYWRDGRDPVDGWTSEPLLPVTPAGGIDVISSESLLEAADRVIPHDAFEAVPTSRGREVYRGAHGEAVSEIDTADGGHQDGEAPIAAWARPDEYRTVRVTPSVPCETVTAEDSGYPILVTRNLGSGHAGFAAIDLFEGSPTAADEPVALAATFGLLDPSCPSRQLVSDSTPSFRSLNDMRIRDFFRQGSISGSDRVMRWLDALGPALIYLLGLPVLVIASRGRGNLILALFVLWSVVFTGIVLYMRSVPQADKAMINEASLYWCEAFSPDEEVPGSPVTTHLYTSAEYMATTSAPRSVSWSHPDALVDEFVDPRLWPYGSVTIESGREVSLPDLPLETVPFHPERAGARDFVIRRAAPELTATGRLDVGPDHAHIILVARLPFPAVDSRLVVSSGDLTIAKRIGPLAQDVHLDFDLAEGTEITRKEALFPDFRGALNAPRSDAETYPTPAEHDIGYVLTRMWAMAITVPVGRAQAYTESRITGRPSRAYFVLASIGVPSEVSVSRGQLERHAVTTMVISIPIVYDERPLIDLN